MNTQHKILIVGAGKIGSSIAKLLSRSQQYSVSICDKNEKLLAQLAPLKNIKTFVLDLQKEPSSLQHLIAQNTFVLSALSYNYNVQVAEMCALTTASYFDLTEDVATTKRIQEIAQHAKEKQVFMPQCGLAPGFVGIVGNDLAKKLDSLDTLHMRVGALPMYPSNMLKYNLTWSTDGLINEYCNPCEVIFEGNKIDVLPLEGLEYFSVDGVKYEAFNTSGGLGTLCDTWANKARNINYKTVRYIGHNELIKFLLNDLRLKNRRKLLKGVFERSIPKTHQDVVVVFCSVTGYKDGELVQITDARKIYHSNIDGEDWSAIQITTASGACVAIDLVANNIISKTGFVSQEEISLDTFLHNQFGAYYNVNNSQVKVKKVDVVIEG